MEQFWYVIMHTKNGKVLYFSDGNKWEFSSKNAIWFEKYNDAKNFCDKYFKAFKGYEIADFYYDINRV